MLVVLLLSPCYYKNHQNEAEYIIKCHFLSKEFPIGLKLNLQGGEPLYKVQMVSAQCVPCLGVLLYCRLLIREAM